MAGKNKARFAKREGNKQESMVRKLDDLIEFDEFQETLLPQIRALVQGGASPEKIRRQFAPLVQAMMTKRALEGDFKAQKDILDRHEGMAVQRVENKTIYAQLDRRELAALTLQKLKDAGVVDAEFNKAEDEETN